MVREAILNQTNGCTEKIKVARVVNVKAISPSDKTGDFIFRSCGF